MERAQVQALMEAVAKGEVAPGDAAERLRTLPYEDLGFAKIDHHRALRKGYAETIFCAGKTSAQVAEIFTRMREHGGNILATRCDDAAAQAVLARHPDVDHNPIARTLRLTLAPPPPVEGFAAVLCAGTSDLPVAEEAAVTCEALGGAVRRVHDVGVAGIHRLLDQREILTQARVLIVCAGMEGALPSVVAGLAEAPVVAVPTSVGYGASFHGLAALLSMLNSCASGVAVVNIDNGFGAGAYAASILRMMSQK